MTRGWMVALAALTFATAAEAKNPQIKIDTSLGAIIVELNPEKAPITVKNFLSYVDDKFFDGTIFHRVIKRFMIQGGGFGQDMVKKGTKAPIKLEAGKGLSNLRGTIAMARTGVKDSATSQFFINHKDNLNLDAMGGGYAVFGKVIKGLEIVDAIASVPTEKRGGQPNLPKPVVVINSISRVKR